MSQHRLDVFDMDGHRIGLKGSASEILIATRQPNNYAITLHEIGDEPGPVIQTLPKRVDDYDGGFACSANVVVQGLSIGEIDRFLLQRLDSLLGLGKITALDPVVFVQKG